MKQLWTAGAYRGQLLHATQCAKITHVLRRDYPALDCSVAKALEVIGERWSLLIVRTVMHGNRRFGEMQESLGDRPQRPLGPAPAAGRRGDPRAARLPGEPAPLRVLPDPEGPRPLARPDRPPQLGRPLLPRPRRPAPPDRPQGVRRHRQRARHLRELRRGADGEGREAGTGTWGRSEAGRVDDGGLGLALLPLAPADLVGELDVLEHHQLVLDPICGTLHRDQVIERGD